MVLNSSHGMASRCLFLSLSLAPWKRVELVSAEKVSGISSRSAPPQRLPITLIPQHVTAERGPRFRLRRASEPSIMITGWVCYLRWPVYGGTRKLLWISVFPRAGSRSRSKTTALAECSPLNPEQPRRRVKIINNPLLQAFFVTVCQSIRCSDE